jgi:CheY-like chemotaxis protein/HPt (histidine-containing phosphotransfer) domain-containing protein
MDVSAPGKDTFLRQLRASRVYAGIPVVFYHGQQSPPDLPAVEPLTYHTGWENLRIKLEEAVRTGAIPSPPAETSGTLADAYPCSILVVEDDHMNRQLVERILTKLGYTPTLVNNGIEGVRTAAMNNFDIIFMDLQMPGMDGLAAAETILSDPSKESMPKIVALSANASPVDREGAFKAGMVDFIAKPIILAQFQECIMKWATASQPQPSDEFIPPAELDSETDSDEYIPASKIPRVEEDIILQTRELDQFSEESILDRLIHAFFKEAPPLIEELEDGFTSNSTFKVAKATTSLIGMCRNLGLTEFSSLAKQIEQECGTADITEMTRLIKSLRESFKHTSAVLKQFLS